MSTSMHRHTPPTRARSSAASRWRPQGPAPWVRRLALAAVVAVAAPVVLQRPAHAQPAPASRSATAMPVINGVDVQTVDRLTPGAELGFTVWGTPRAAASLEISGATRRLVLEEVRPGVYEGVYTISSRDRLAPDARVVASLRQGNRVSTVQLDEPLQQDWQPAPTQGPGGAPVIQRFQVTQAGDTRRGTRERVLLLRLDGTPGARAWARLPGAETRRIRLDETSPGVYTARYTVSAADDLRADADAQATLRLGDRRSDITLPRALAGVGLPQRVSDLSPYCSDCATVVAINKLQVAGDASPVGAVAGGLLGAVIGSQIGKGDGRTAAGVAGAVGGAVIGHQVDKRRSLRDQYEVVLRLPDGRQQTLMFDAAPSVQAGARVRVIDGRLVEPGT